MYFWAVYEASVYRGFAMGRGFLTLHSFGAQVDDGAPTGPLKRGMAQGGVCSEP